MAEKKTLTVKLQVKELMYDLENKTHLTSRAREATGTGYEAAWNMQASDGCGESYQVRRTLADAFAALKSLLGEYLAEEEGSTSGNLMAEAIDNDGELLLRLELPGNYNGSGTEALGSAIHEYLVDAALGEWFAITAPEEAGVYVQRSAVSLERIKRALYGRRRPERPNYN